VKGAFAVAVIMAGSVAAASAQEPGRFKSRADMVLIDALVTNDRRVVTGLTASDFELHDNGVPQSIEQLYIEQLPLTIIMVLDISGSVGGERLDALKKGAMVVVDRLRQADQAAIVSFSGELNLAAQVTGDRAKLHQTIVGLKAQGGTALRDAIFAGLVLRGAARTRTLIIVFSDGVDTGSILSEERVSQVARRSDATVYAIGIREQPRFVPGGGRAIQEPDTATDDRFLTRIAEETGGRLLHAQQNREIASTFGRVIDEFNSRYVLGYVPAGVPGNGWHPVTVRLKKRQGTVLARRGYIAD
jgi:Ca-activated chloride channel family protein